ncbi:hypothetical protein [Agrococcus jenensis]|uniref:ABC transporter n=1 Tax=Agrococcus jenensis TaxID=46353 RepID=A0A3N2AR81_9MICO|nr:hypothetical protein [Agrococcus jenensis]ROR65557.1 hypothetical protein EDD26_0923 [Agrococcus jenensis]
MTLRPTTLGPTTLGPTTHRRGAAGALLAIAALALAGCSAPAPAAPSATGDATERAVPHGYVEGAAELAEPQHLLTAVGADGEAHLLDPLDESVEQLGALGEVEALTHDGRFLAATTADGVTLVDTGVWTVDHADHVHYYRADPRVVGDLDLAGPVSISSTESRTAVLGGDEVVLLDRDALGRGELVETGRFDAAAGGFATPAGDGAIVARDGAVVVLDAAGTQLASEPCAAPAGGIVTRVSAVVGCEAGAVLATETDAGVQLEAIALPAGTVAELRPTGFGMRAGRATTAAVAGEAGFWLLDTRERTWTLVETPVPLKRVVAVDDEAGHVVAIAADGRVLVLDEAGAALGATEPVLAAALADPGAAASLALEVDANRAYVPVAADDAVLEIDYADGARIARTLSVPAPLHLAETGR